MLNIEKLRVINNVLVSMYGFRFPPPCNKILALLGCYGT